MIKHPGRHILLAVVAALLALAPATSLAAGPLEGRHLAPGDRDTAFGRGGLKVIDFGQSEDASAVSVDEAGRATLAGSSFRAGSIRDARLAFGRLRPDGSLDETFGQAGRRTIDLTPSEDRAFVWDRARDGGMLALGAHGGRGCSSFCDGYFLSRHRPSGKLDRSFGAAGVVLGRLGGDFPGSRMSWPCRVGGRSSSSRRIPAP